MALSQYLLRYTLLLPILARNSSGDLRVSDASFLLFVAMTVCTAAAGYVINDLIDEPIDRLNKPEKLFIGTHFSSALAYRIYGFLVAFGGVCSTVLSKMRRIFGFWCAILRRIRCYMRTAVG